MIRAELARRKDKQTADIKAELHRRRLIEHLKGVYPDDWEDRAKTLEETVLNNPWIPDECKLYPPPKISGLTPKQAELLTHGGSECLFGGAARGGKSYGALMVAAQYVDNPNYHALVLRRNYAQMAKAESILNLSKSWWFGKVNWNGETRTWTFPSGATIEFGHMEGPDSHLNFQGAVWQTVVFDELTQFAHEHQYEFLFTRQSRPEGSTLPIRVVATSNPGGPGMTWVKNRFIDPKTKHPTAHFIPAFLKDNPNVDRVAYTASLTNVDPITRAQMLEGDWNAVKGGRFLKEWFRYYRHDDEGFLLLYDKSGNVIERFLPWSRPRWQTYDPSAGKSENSDHFVISTWCLSPLSNLVWLDCHRDRQEIPDQLAVAQRLYRRWQPQFMAVEEVLNQKAHAQILRRSTDPVMNIHSVSPLGKSKLERATPSLVFAASGRLYLPEDNRAFPLDDVEGELVRFTGEDGNPDDICDTFFYSNQCLTMVSPYANSSPGDLIPAVRERTAIPGREEARRKHLFGRTGNAPGVVRPKW